ncbi:hypothetical protein GDO86_005547 [Hymenochirus boettgeri]|uniref:Cadherin-related family member 2 n=1 Tax=Hymenochirus boettgeri TaxID=247094 RepID=A0A8T2JAB8_9PIPI|nr:hypothetical protein GDO86_005547 [Hymenochirus boettgeri]
MTYAKINEDTPVGVGVFWIVAIDNEGDSLKYGIEGVDSYYFKVNQSTGEVQLALPLDYESKIELSIFIKVQDGNDKPVIRPFIVLVEDNNDNAPVFLNTPYEAKLYEVIPNNQESINLFYIDKNGSIILNGSLNYNTKSTFYQLNVRAMDRGGKLHNQYIQHNTTVYVSIKITDLPDLDPQFINSPYVISIPENIAMGSTILRVSAIDGDKGINDDIQYTINSFTVPGLFNINSNTGDITVIGDVDRENLVKEDEQVLLTVMAQEKHLNVKGENATSVTNVTVRVIDINDHKPHFYNCEIDNCNFTSVPIMNFVGHIEEHSPVRVPVANLTITAYDPDKDKNGAFILYLRGKNKDFFSVSPSKVQNAGLIQILVKDPLAVDYEKVHQMEVEIVANDTSNPIDCCSYALVTINIIDINDHTPEFSQDTYRLNVKENCPDGTEIGIIMATDLDSGELGRITYQLLPESINEFFHVNSLTGNITVVKGSLLDRERRSLYYATLRAQDGMNATGTTLLEITILDINDETPTAIGTYNFNVNEKIDNVSIQIEAFDADEPNTNNSRIEFLLLPSLMSSNFSINVTTGLITNIAPLDREAIEDKDNGRIVLTVKLYDLGIPSLSSEVNVTINVEDLNDNIPIFSQTQYSFSVNERAKGEHVGNLMVSDKDQTELNNRVSFRISQGGSGNFIIRAQKMGSGSYDGILSLEPEIELDYEKQQNYTLIIEAQDNGLQGISYTANATAIVEVVDVNDEPPIVEPTSLIDLFVIENRTVGVELLTTLKAIDPDTIHELEFQELSVQCFKNGKDVDSVCYSWLWLAPDGQLFVNHTDKVDYEECDLVVILLRIEDKLTLIGDRYSKNESLRVNILDSNDNAPKFGDVNEAFVVVPGIAPIDYQVALVKATDNDTGINAVIKFSITSVLFIFSSGGTKTLSNIFNIVTSSEKNNYLGSIRVASSLDVSLKGQYQVTVNASDSGSPSLSATRVLDIFAVDDSYQVTLKFSQSVQAVQDSVEKIKMSLTKATKATVYVSQIKEAEATARNNIFRASSQCIMVVYFVYSNGTAITPEEVNRMIQSDSESLSELLQLGLFVIGKDNTSGTQTNETLFAVIAGLAGALVLILLIMITALVCMRKSHKRKLRAVNALRVAKALPAEAAQGLEAIPGTNKFNSDRTNPMLNLDINPIIDLGFEENSSISDSVSVNSIDDNMVARIGVHFSDLQESQDTSMPYEKEDSQANQEPLAAALNDRIKTSYSNTALNTTDL